MQPIDLRNDKLHKRLTVKIDEYGRAQVSYTNGSDTGVASFAPDTKSAEEYIAALRTEIFGSAEMPPNV